MTVRNDVEAILMLYGSAKRTSKGLKQVRYPHLKNVRRLDIAVNDTLAMRLIERIGNFDGGDSSLPKSLARLPIKCFSVTPSRNSIAMKACPSCSPMS